MLDCKKAGRQIALLRKKKGLTQEDVASWLRISPQAVSKWENGHTMPELSLLVELAQLLDCTIDGILFPAPLPATNADFEHILLPYAPIAEFTGRSWPRSMAVPALLSALKLFMGLEGHRDAMGRQINDDTEYILQSAYSSMCFGYSWGDDNVLEDGLGIYGMTGEVHSRADCSEEDFIGLAVKNIMGGYPVIIVPKEYTDVILATGFSGRGKVLKGISFLDGDDEKNSVMSFRQLKSFPEWYTKEFDMLLIKPYERTVSTAIKCREALRKGVRLLGNQVSISDRPLVGYGMVIYDNWCNELRKENNRNLVEMGTLSPHIFIHYEGKLRIREFLELCLHLLKDMDPRPVVTAISKYDEIVEMCEKCMNQLLAQTPENIEEARAKRQMLIGVLQRSKELETEALKELALIV